jgi:hypothetical protein
MRTIAIPRLYSSFHGYVLQRIPDNCETRLMNMLWLMLGIFQSRSVQLNLVARKVPVRAKKLSVVKRLGRFLDNAAVRVRAWYDPFVIPLLRAAASTGQVRLIMDGSKVSHGHQLLMVSLAYTRRSLPLAWTWVHSSRGHSPTRLQVALLAYVYRLLPSGIPVSLVGDCEFDSPLLIEKVCYWGWTYALRQAGNHWIQGRDGDAWQRIDSLPLKPGMSLWKGYLLLTRTSPYPTHLVAHWQRGQAEPWFLATNLLCPQAAIRLYRLRMWIEERFGDLKKPGFDLEMTHLRNALRLSRLTFVVCGLYLWLVALGEHVLSHDLAALIDRTDRRDLSVFRLGWDFLEDCWRLDDPIPRVSIPNLCSVSGG